MPLLIEMSAITVRRVILTSAVAAVTIAGSIYGATLKGDREALQVSCIFVASDMESLKANRPAKESKRVREASIEERLAILQARKERLVLEKHDLEGKIKRVGPRTNDSKDAI